MTGLIAAVLLWPEDQAPEAPKDVSAPNASSDGKIHPRPPEYDGRERRYGAEDRPVPESDRYYDRYFDRDFAPPPPPAYGYPGGRETPYGIMEPEPRPMERFSFRPLSDREKARLESERPDAFYGGAPATVPQPYSGWPRQPGPSSAYSQAPTYPDWYGEGYSYRQGDRYRTDGEIRRSPYGDWRDRPDDRETWSGRPEPEWGSQPRDWAPPAQRMYPSLGADPGRRLTAR